MSSDNKKIKGRPSKKEQIDIQRKLRRYFRKGYSTTFTSEKTGHNIKTVQRYFKIWTKEILQTESKDFLQRCKEERERILLGLDEKIYSIDKAEKEVDKLINDLKKLKDFSLLEKFLKLKLKMNLESVNLYFKKFEVVNFATFDTRVDLEKKSGDVL